MRKDKSNVPDRRNLLHNRERAGKLLVTAVSCVFLGILYQMIFCLSAQDAEESGSLSRTISIKCVESVNFLAGGRWKEDEVLGLAEIIEHPVRKLAHFSEYGVMGISVYVLLSQWMKRGWRLRLLTTAWVFVSAAGDEFHQYFVPGRYASAADVALDTCGGICGMLFCICAAALYRKHGRAGAVGNHAP